MKKSMLFGLMFCIMVTSVFAAISSDERVSISAPSSVGVNSNFDLTYSASGVSGLWGIPVEQSVNGACTLPNDGLAEEGKVYLNNGAGTVLTQQVRSNGVGTCSYSGIYFVDGQQHTLNTVNVNVVEQTSCTPDWRTGEWGACVDGSQGRGIYDDNNCDSDVGRPPAIQSCSINDDGNDDGSDEEDSSNFFTDCAFDVDRDGKEPFCIAWWMIIGGAIVVLLLFSKK